VPSANATAEAEGGGLVLRRMGVRSAILSVQELGECGLPAEGRQKDVASAKGRRDSRRRAAETAKGGEPTPTPKAIELAGLLDSIQQRSVGRFCPPFRSGLPACCLAPRWELVTLSVLVRSGVAFALPSHRTARCVSFAAFDSFSAAGYCFLLFCCGRENSCAASATLGRFSSPVSREHSVGLRG
jgi:hypothetical protein